MNLPPPHLLAFVILSLVIPQSAQSAVIYSGLQNIAIGQNLAGVYLNVVSGATSGTQPVDWTTAPWINPFFGGVSIGSSELLRPNVTGGNQILQLAVGTIIDSSRTYAAGESGSSTHVGGGGNQFTLGASQLMGFVMQTGTGSPLFYGWLRLIIDNSGTGTLQDWAYDNTANTGIQAGFNGSTFVIPEPSRALLLMLGISALQMRRRRA